MLLKWPKSSSLRTHKFKRCSISAWQHFMPLAPISNHLKRRALLSTTVHQHRLIATHCSLIRRVLRPSSVHRSLLCNAPLCSGMPLCSHVPHARDADKCTAHRNASFGKRYAISAASVDTLRVCATRLPAPCAPNSRITRLLQWNSDQVRYIFGMTMLTIFFSAQGR